MKKDAEAHAEEDRARQEEVQVRNTADTLAYSAEKTLTEAGDKIPADTRGSIDTAVRDVRDALGGDSVEAVRSATERLSAALQAAGAALYGQDAEDGVGEGFPPGGEGADDADGAEEGTVEGEYREV
jgi:molecular chaperone DnaK